METAGKYFGRQVYWLDYSCYSREMPDKDWVCLAISNSRPNLERFEAFVRTSIAKGILEFKAHGAFGELLHDIFDETVVYMEAVENHTKIDVMTTWHNNESLADTFWQCFFATCLPQTSDLENISIVCTDLDGLTRTEELKTYINKFEAGWLPL